MSITFKSQCEHVAELIKDDSPDNLDIIIAFYLGVCHGQSNTTSIAEATSKACTNFNRRYIMASLTSLLGLVGSTGLSNTMKQKLATVENPFEIIDKLNKLVGRDISVLLPFRDQLASIKFHEEFMSYQQIAHQVIPAALAAQLVSALKEIKGTTSRNKQNNLNKLYDKANLGCSFISFDIKKANWTALQLFDEKLPDWEEFTDKHLPAGPFKELFVKSKRFRHMVVGGYLRSVDCVKALENTQSNLVGRLKQCLNSSWGQPYCESNDEVIYLLYDPSKIAESVEICSSEDYHIFRPMIITIDSINEDGSFKMIYHDPITKTTTWQLRCTKPELIEALL